MDARVAERTEEMASLGVAGREDMALACLSAMDMSPMMDGFVWDTPEHDAAIHRALCEFQELDVDDCGLVGEANIVQPDIGGGCRLVKDWIVSHLAPMWMDRVSTPI